MRPYLVAVVSVLASVIGLNAVAQPLADKLPDDTVFYLGWQGASAAVPGYAGSHFQAILDGSNIPQFYSEFIPRLAEFAATKDRDLAEMLPMMSPVVKALWSYPSAIYFGGLDMGGHEPMPRLAVLINAGADADNVHQSVAAIIEKMHDGPPLTSEVKDGIVVIAFGKALPETLAASLAGQGKSLQNDPEFKGAMDQLVKQPVVAGYINFTNIWTTIDHLAPPARGNEPSWTMIRDTLGLPGMKALAFDGGFEGKDFACGAFLAAPAPRTGLLKAIESTPIDDEFLKIVPKGSLSMSAARFRPAVMIDLARAIWPMFGEQAPPIDSLLQQASAKLGFDIDKDFLSAFGDEWAVYTDSAIGGTGLVGTVLVNRNANGEKLEQSFTSLEQMANAFMAANGPDKDVKFQIKTQQVGDLKLHYVAVPFVTPSWAFKDGHMFVGLYPQTVIGAVDLAAKKGPSILENEKYEAVRKRLNEVKVTQISFKDLQRTVPETYGQWVAVTSSIRLADMFGIDSPLLMLPPIKVVMENIGPSGSVGWVDDAGFHARGITPFPGADALGTDLIRVYAAQAPLIASFLMPSLAKARMNANRVKDAANLRQIGQMCMIYANEYNGKLPANLGELAKEDAYPMVFISPLSDRHVSVTATTPEDRAKWINENSDYVYLGSGMKMADAHSDMPLAFLKPEIARMHGGTNVLYGDGHVEWVGAGEAEKLFDKVPK